MDHTLQSCSGCVFCILTEVGYQDYIYICNLGLDDIFHERNDDKWDTIGCETINKHPDTPCKARYTADEIRAILYIK